MSVRAVRPRVPAIHGLVHRHDCAGDCCNYDEFTDALATGDDIYSSDIEVPSGRGMRRFNHLVTGELRTAGRRVESQSRVHASSPTETGCDGRGSAPSLQQNDVAARDVASRRASTPPPARSAGVFKQTRPSGRSGGS